MKKLLLTAIFAIVSTAFINAQDYYIAVQNCTEIGQEFSVEIVASDCSQSGYVSGTIGALSFAYFQVVPLNDDLSGDDVIAWAQTQALCSGESSAVYSSDIGCASTGNQTGNASCIGNYTITEFFDTDPSIALISCSTVPSSPAGTVLGVLTINSF